MPQPDGGKKKDRKPDYHLLPAMLDASGMNFIVDEIFPFLSHSKYMALATLRRNKKPGWKEGGNNLDPKDKDESSDENP